jgi:hypothetical protein
MRRRLLQSSLLALAAATPFTARAALAPGSAAVVAVQPTRIADLVLLDHGFNAGLRQGMVCRVTRGGAEIAEVLLVELRPTCGSALIVHLAPGQSIRTGDTASVKVLKT